MFVAVRADLDRLARLVREDAFLERAENGAIPGVGIVREIYFFTSSKNSSIDFQAPAL